MSKNQESSEFFFPARSNFNTVSKIILIGITKVIERNMTVGVLFYQTTYIYLSQIMSLISILGSFLKSLCYNKKIAS